MYIYRSLAMDKVTLSEARKRLSELIRAAERGESGPVTRRGKEVARIVPADRKIGSTPLISSTFVVG